MAKTHKTLVLGYIANSQTDLYDPAGGVKAHVHNLTIHNTNTSTETVELWVHDGTTAYKIFKEDLVANETQIVSWENEGMILDGSLKLQGKTTTANKVTIKGDGTEEV